MVWHYRESPSLASTRCASGWSRCGLTEQGENMDTITSTLHDPTIAAIA
jgi:hypothetical protein